MGSDPTVAKRRIILTRGEAGLDLDHCRGGAAGSKAARRTHFGMVRKPLTDRVIGLAIEGHRHASPGLLLNFKCRVWWMVSLAPWCSLRQRGSLSRSVVTVFSALSPR
jgi:hypothetical protein